MRKSSNTAIFRALSAGQWLRSVVCLIWLLSFSLPGFSQPSMGGGEEGNIIPGSGGGSVKQFAINGYSFQGEYLIIDYFVPFPGMTKVKLFQGEDLLWRGQYVNEKGDHKLILRGSKLVPGTGYTFHFSYKNEDRTLPVTGR